MRPDVTGFGRVSRRVLEYLKARGHDIFEIGVGFVGQEHHLPWPTFSPNAWGRKEGQDCAATIAQKVNADVLIVYEDVPDWAVWGDLESGYDRDGKGPNQREATLADNRSWALGIYTPVDSNCPNGHIPSNWHPAFHGVDSIAVPSKYGVGILARNGISSIHLPHGVDLDNFKPIPKSEARKMIGIPEEMFVVGFVGVNQRRKQIPSLFKVMCRMTPRYGKQSALWLHVHPDQSRGWDLLSQVRYWGLEKQNVAWQISQGLADQDIPKLYSAFDVLLHLSGGGGFELPVLEAAACGTPVLATDYAAMSEMVPNSLQRIPVREFTIEEPAGIMWAIADADVAAERVDLLWRDPDLRIALGEQSLDFAKQYDWHVLLPEFEKWITTLPAKKQDIIRLQVI